MKGCALSALIWGFSRVVQRKGQRVLVPLKPGGEYIPTKCNSILDIDINTVGLLLGQNLEDWTLLFVYCKDKAKFEPPNGSNCAAFVPRRKISIPCGRVICFKIDDSRDAPLSKGCALNEGMCPERLDRGMCPAKNVIGA